MKNKQYSIIRKLRLNFFKGLFCFLIIGLSSCGQEDLGASKAASETGVAGSLARFSVVGNYMYVLNSFSIKWYDVSTANNPIYVGTKEIGNGIETIFPFAGKLFIGSQQGMFIYNIKSNGEPEYISEYTHIQNCDPVTTNGQYAFVTLRSGGDCRVGFSNNQLDILDVSDVLNPQLISSWDLVHPRGVGVDGNTLFVCDSEAGLKIYDVQDPLNIQLIKHFENITTYDVIPLNGLLLVIGPSNIYQFDYSDLNNIKKVSELPIEV